MIRHMISFIRFVYRIGRKISRTVNRHHVGAYAGQASFFVVISAVPFLILLFTILDRMLPEDPSLLLAEIVDLAPETLAPFLTNVFDEIIPETNGSVLSLSGLTLLWAASKGTRSLNGGIRSVWGIEEGTGWIRRYIGSVIATFLLLLTVAASVTAILFHEYLFDLLPEALASLLYGMRFLLFLVILTLVLMIFYALGVGREVKINRHFVGALLSSLGITVFSAGYGFYISHIAQVGHIYGSLSAMMLLVLWIYFCMIILLIGAEVNALLEKARFGEKKWNLSPL